MILECYIGTVALVWHGNALRIEWKMETACRLWCHTIALNQEKWHKLKINLFFISNVTLRGMVLLPTKHNSGCEGVIVNVYIRNVHCCWYIIGKENIEKTLALENSTKFEWKTSGINHRLFACCFSEMSSRVFVVVVVLYV